MQRLTTSEMLSPRFLITRFMPIASCQAHSAFRAKISLVYIHNQYHIKVSPTKTSGGIMRRDIELALGKLHILYHAGKEEVFGVGLIITP
jgi:hypothetical protein